MPYNPDQPRNDRGEWAYWHGKFVLYHGSGHEFGKGDLVESGHRHGKSVYTGKAVFSTDDLRKAKEYAHEAAGPGQVPRVYAVVPTGDVGKAPERNAWKSEAPMKVVGTVWEHPREKCDAWGCHYLEARDPGVTIQAAAVRQAIELGVSPVDLPESVFR